MKLTVKDAARILSVSEEKIHRWIKQGVIPAYQINEQYRFNRAELLEWATSRKISVPPELFADTNDGEPPPPSLSQALDAGGIYHRIGGTDKASVLQAVVDVMKLPPEIDPKFLYEVLLAREALGSTGIGDGIAIPHVRNPIVLQVVHPRVTLCFLQRPIDFGAMDGQPVSTLFTFISPTVRTHLHLLSRLGFALRNANFKSAITQQSPADQITTALIRAEKEMETKPRPAAAIEQGAD